MKSVFLYLEETFLCLKGESYQKKLDIILPSKISVKNVKSWMGEKSFICVVDEYRYIFYFANNTEYNFKEITSFSTPERLDSVSIKTFPEQEKILLSIDNKTHYFFSSNQWSQINLPDNAEHITMDKNGELLSIGKHAYKKNESILFYWIKSNENCDWNKFQIGIESFWQELKTRWAGGLYSLDNIYKFDNQVFLVSQCAWFFEDPSCFVFFKDTYKKKFFVHRFPWQGIVFIYINSKKEIFLFTDIGEIWKWKNNSWVSQKINKKVTKILNETGIKTDGIDIKVSVKDNNINYIAKLPQKTVMLYSNDFGFSWKIFDIVDNNKKNVFDSYFLL